MFKFKIVLFVALFLIMCLLNGCANIVSGKTQAVTFQSRPENAEVYINSQKVGLTPIVVQVQRSKTTAVTFKLDGHEDSTIQLQTKLNGWFFGNVAFSYFSTFSSTTDVTTDASVEYEPNMIFGTLVPKGKTLPIVGITDNNSKVARYIVINYKALGVDLSKDEGEHLEALLDLLSVAKENRIMATKRMKDLYMQSDSAPVFAKEVEANLTNKP